MKQANQIFQLFRNARLATLLFSLLVVSCGGSVILAGIGGTGISFGTVLGFGSIIVNGSELDDSTASVTLDGIPSGSLGGLNSGIKPGMVVKVSGDFSGNSGIAATIVYKDNLEGPVCDLVTPIDTSIPITGIINLRVLGQTVILDAATFVDNSTLSIDPLDIVEVSGLPNSAGEIQASFVQVKNSASVIEVKGRVDAVNGSILTINSLEVDFSGLGVVDNSIPNSTPAIGQFVEVKGNSKDFTCGGGSTAFTDTLTATVVELESEGAGDISASDHNEVEGLVTVALNPPGGPGTFKIGNRDILTTSSTRYLPLLDFGPGDIELGTKVEAEGTSAGGVLTATKISFRENVKLESNVASGNSSSFTLVGFPGITITTNSATTGDAPAGHIRVRGIEGPNNTVLATDIKSQSGASIILQGAVDNSLGPLDTEITILGILVDTILIPDISSNFQDVSGGNISRATFLNLVQPGVLVKFKGDLTASPPPTVTWGTAELEDD